MEKLLQSIDGKGILAERALADFGSLFFLGILAAESVRWMEGWLSAGV